MTGHVIVHSFRELAYPSMASTHEPFPRVLGLALAFLLALPLLVAPGVQGVAASDEGDPDPLTCEGYPEPRVFLESQDWWQPTLHGEEDFGHVHGGACFPRTHLEDGSLNKVSGTVRFDMRVMMHDNPGLLRYVRVHLTDRDDNHYVFREFIEERCEVGGENWDEQHNSCVWWVPVEIDTTVANYDGFQEIRMAASVRQEETDDSMFNTTGWQLYLDNGNEVRHYRANSDGSPREFLEGRGWYEGAGYTNARLESRLPHVVSGVWEPRVRMRDGSGGIDVQHSFASVNGNFHHDDPGVVLLDEPDAFRGTLRIDTTQLPDGPNRLFLRADAPCDGSPGNDCGSRANGSTLNDSTNSGALAIVFHVDNGNPAEDGHQHDHGDDDGTSADDPAPDEGAGGDGGSEAGEDDSASDDRDADVAPKYVSLSVESDKTRGRNVARLLWDGAQTEEMDVYLNGSRLASVPNSGSWTHETGTRGNPAYVYQVCESGGGACSEEVTVSSW
jgi:hypothetical protein